MGDYRRDVMSPSMDLDLNNEPLEDLADDSLLGLGFMQGHEVQSTRLSVEDRFRHLEAAYTRARWRQTTSGLPYVENYQLRNPPPTALNNMIEDTRNEGQEVPERTKGVKRNSTHLVAKALDLDMGVTKAVGDGEGFFDCNICLDTVTEPILTCCGHLFCWACFYMLPYIYSTAKECPVCKGEVTDSSITPIYGNGNGNGKGGAAKETLSGQKIPPRPKANRIESTRLTRFTRRVLQIPVQDAYRRIRVGITGTMGQQENVAGSGPRRNRSRLGGQSEADTSPNSLPRMFDAAAEFLAVNDDGMGEDLIRQPSFGFIFDTPHIDTHPPEPVAVDLSVNESQAPSSSRRRNRAPRGRRRGSRN